VGHRHANPGEGFGANCKSAVCEGNRLQQEPARGPSGPAYLDTPMPPTRQAPAKHRHWGSPGGVSLDFPSPGNDRRLARGQHGVCTGGDVHWDFGLWEVLRRFGTVTGRRQGGHRGA
jgi:hypothetical protein